MTKICTVKTIKKTSGHIAAILVEQITYSKSKLDTMIYNVIFLRWFELKPLAVDHVSELKPMYI